MIDIWTWPTPNGQKVHIAVEELGLPYTIIPVNIGKAEQFKPEFLALNPNNRIPVIVDNDGPGGKFVLFESGAILIYLAEKAGRLIPNEPGARYACLQWLMFQMGGVGPMFGQLNHFATFAPEQIPYAIDRYQTEVVRLARVMEKRLSQAEYLAGRDYSIADIASFTWVRSAARRNFLKLADTPAVERWLETIGVRPAVQRGLAIMAEQQPKLPAPGR